MFVLTISHPAIANRVIFYHFLTQLDDEDVKHLMTDLTGNIEGLKETKLLSPLGPVILSAFLI